MPFPEGPVKVVIIIGVPWPVQMVQVATEQSRH